ncbi:MAG: DUF5117 domain-containing protein [Planctomycetota bacterium]|nr:MAG: DUF5117 domain-containing protein [Planctomycetota bacterium]
MPDRRKSRSGRSLLGVVGLAAACCSVALGGARVVSAQQQSAQKRHARPKAEFPPYKKVIEGYEKVISTADGKPPLYTLWVDRKKGQMLAELPRNFERQKIFLGYTIASGIPTAGIQTGDGLFYWKRFDKRLALIQPQLLTRTTGDFESKQSREQLFTDRVVLDVPIVTMSPKGGPVIDMDALFVGQASKFFGPAVMRAKTRLASIAKAKSFPENITFAFDLPLADGQITTLAYSISLLPERTGFKPRKADPRVGYFVTVFDDLGRAAEPDSWTRYINRWRLEKADPKLALSPPKDPIVFYIDHKTPIRYRRWVREGVLEWNKAFEKIGIVNAIEVYQQDARTGAHMDKDPEDVRYNFIVWNSNHQSFAIGPSRVDPRTGEILDADVVMNDGWLRVAAQEYKQFVEEEAMENFGPDVIAWLDEHPQWDPRVRLASPAERQRILRSRAAHTQDAAEPATGLRTPQLLGDEPFDGLAGRISQLNGMCTYAMDRGMDLAMVRTGLLKLHPPDGAVEGNGEIDGAPEWFVGGLIKDVIMHEVGHVLGLRHNFKASTAFTLDQINSKEWREAGKPIAGSVMDYNAMNFHFGDKEEQGPYFMPTIGPYDYWAIEYGYTFNSKDLGKIASRVSEPELAYATDEDTFGPDPRARRRDMGRDPLAFNDEEFALVQDLRKKILDKAVKKGDSWQNVRDAYMGLLFEHFRLVGNAANWVGGVFVNRDRVGDPGDRLPNEVAPAKDQRRALEQVIKYTFYDESFGLTPELVSHFGLDKWWDAGGFNSVFEEPQLEIHNLIMGIQASAMTMVMNPVTLRRVYDNEFRVPASEDAITLAEVMRTITDAVWSELDDAPGGRYTARKPMISSLRRNLQREHLERLIALTTRNAVPGAAGKPLAQLAAMHLREINRKISDVLRGGASRVDPYTRAHLEDAQTRIEKALDAMYIYRS